MTQTEKTSFIEVLLDVMFWTSILGNVIGMILLIAFRVISQEVFQYINLTCSSLCILGIILVVIFRKKLKDDETSIDNE